MNLLSLSHSIHISKDDLTLFFDQCLNTTFRIWLSDIRFAAAKKMMIENPDYSNDIISSECGFSSRTHLSRRGRRVRRLPGGSAIWPKPTIRTRLFRSRGTTPFLRI